MAGWVQDGGAQHGGAQQGFNIGYHPDWYSGANPFAAPADNYTNSHSILNTSEDAFMTNFFNNPDAAPADDGLYNMNWPALDEKPNGTDLGGHWNSQGINPSMTLAETFNSAFQTHTNHTQHLLPHTPTAELDPLQHSQDSEIDVRAASDLWTMAVNSHHGARDARPFEAAAGSSWAGNHDLTLHLPQNSNGSTTPSGMHRSNSYIDQPHNHAQAAHYYQNGSLSNQIMMGHQRQLQHMADHVPNGLRPRHLSLQSEPTNFTFFPQEQPRTPQSAFNPGQSSGRPPLVHFGSDPHFKGSVYTGLSTQIPIEHEKGANLNNVPFAHQVAAGSHVHMPPATPVTPSSYGRHIFPHGPDTYNPASTSSSPNTLGGLPTTNMAPTPNRHGYGHGHPPHSAARATAVTEYEGDSEEDADADLEETRPLKRRKSQLEAEDDAEYTPGKHHVRAPALKRGSKTSKAPAFDGSDDDDDYEQVPSSSRASAKRRKSSTNARPSLGSSQSGSPANMASPTGRQIASSKKKVRGSQPRTNLTEDEKRRNHIASEKTRRDLIRLQYDQLDSMVPALKEGKSGLSRSDILKEIAVFVEGTIEGNKKIEAIFSGPPPGPRYGAG